MKTKRKTVQLWCVNYCYETGHTVYPIKVYETAVEAEMSGSNSLFRTEEEAQTEADKRELMLDEKKAARGY